MCWQPAKRRGFKVCSYYRVLNTASNHSFPWKSIWKPKVPSRVFFFFFGLHLWGKFQQLIIYEKEMFGYWIGVICVKISGNH